MFEIYGDDNIISIEEKNDCLVKIFYRMFLGLLVTAVTAYVTYNTGLLNGISYGLAAIIEFAIVIFFSNSFKKLSSTVVSILFYTYAIVNGFSMSIIFYAFDMSTIYYAFGVSALLFGALALYGKTTQKDMSKFGTILSIALIIGLIFSIINLIIGNSMLDIILDWVILLIFCGLTAYDLNKLVNEPNYIGCDAEKLYIYGAMELYLDFINIFIRLLSIFARRRD